MKTFGKALLILLVVFLLLQCVRPSIPYKPAAAEIQAPLEVKQIFQKDCYSCHSDERRLAWFDEIVPGYWLVRQDVLTARAHLNFSTLGTKPAAAQKAALYEAVNMIQLGAMPLPRFLALHPDARVTPAELAVLKAYLAPWSAFNSTQLQTTSAETISPVSLAGVQSELNGLAFDPSFETWRLLSITDRGDNNTFRFILGNDVAVQAAESGHISPWPDGARFAKIAWQQQRGADGLVHPGGFVQVELMVKHARQYRSTEGWGWGRWRGLDLKPYGKDAQFTGECTTCHLPMRGNDFVYTIPISTASISREETINTAAASLPEGLPWHPLRWRPITMYVDPASHAMALLYGNDIAMEAVNSRTAELPVYSSGSVLALVTWAQREDPHWFGARIPDTPRMVEFVKVGALGAQSFYQRYAGTGLVKQTNGMADAQRADFLLHLVPARLP